MLVLQRKCNEEVVIDGCIRVKILSVRGNSVRVGIEAPDEISIIRGELIESPAQVMPCEASDTKQELTLTVAN